MDEANQQLEAATSAYVDSDNELAKAADGYDYEAETLAVFEAALVKNRVARLHFAAALEEGGHPVPRGLLYDVSGEAEASDESPDWIERS
ncbi:MAG: hypothetical protein ACRDPG_02225 [Nocardioidaceae bacterium]